MDCGDARRLRSIVDVACLEMLDGALGRWDVYMHVTTPRCFRIDDGVAFDLPKDLRLQLGNPCRICATMDDGVFSCFQN